MVMIMNVYMVMTVQQKLVQHCKSTIIFKKLKNKEKAIPLHLRLSSSALVLCDCYYQFCVFSYYLYACIIMQIIYIFIHFIFQQLSFISKIYFWTLDKSVYTEWFYFPTNIIYFMDVPLIIETILLLMNIWTIFIIF